MTRARVLQGAVIGALLFAWTYRPIWDIDIFFHVAIGRELMAHGVPSTDLFSAAQPDAPWTPFQLGYALLCAKLDAQFGLDGLRVLHSLVLAIAGVVLLVQLRVMSASRAAATMLFALFWVLYDERVRLRPHVFNLLFEAVVLLPIARLGPRAGRLVSGPVLFAVALIWSALHAMGALWLPAVIGCYLIAKERDTREFAWRSIAIALIGIALAPGSAGGILHVLRIQDQWKEFVPELGPSWAFFSMGGVYGYFLGIAPMAVLALVVVAWMQRPAREHWPALLCATGMAVSSIWLARLDYYAVFALALCWPVLRDARWWRASERTASTEPDATVQDRPETAVSTNAIKQDRPQRGPQLAFWAYVAAAGLVVLIGMQVAPRFVTQRVSPLRTLYPGAFPEAECDALAGAGIEGRAYNEMRWGGYLLYRLFPNVRVLSDGRITFSREVAELLRHETSEPPRVVAEVAYRRFGIDLLIWRVGRMQPNTEWQLLVRGPVAEVWSRTGPLLDARRRALTLAASHKSAAR